MSSAGVSLVVGDVTMSGVMGEIPESRRLARELVRRAEAGEQVEVCAGSSVRTEIRVYDGDVESLTVAESRGVGVRVIRDGREGSPTQALGPRRDRHALAEARDNMSFAEPDDRVGLAEPDGVDAADIDPWDDRIEATSVDDKVAIAVRSKPPPGAPILGFEASAPRCTPTPAVRAPSSPRRDRRLGSRASASIGTQPLIDDPDGSTRTGYAGDAPRRRSCSTSRRSPGSRRAGVRLLGAGPHTGRPLVVLEPRFTATILGIVAGMLSGELVVKGRTPFGDRVGEAIATEALTMFDDPTDLTRSAPRPSTAKVSPVGVFR